MDNVRPFERKLAPVANIESQDVVSATPPAVNEEPALVIPLSVIRALGFYALQGADGGDIARQALASIGFGVIQEIPGKGAVVPIQDAAQAPAPA